MRVDSLLPEAFRGKRLKKRFRGRQDQPLDRLRTLHVVLKERTLERHRIRMPEDEPGLLDVRGGTIDLGAGFSVGREHVERDPRAHRGLPVLFWNLDVRPAEPPCPIRPHPPEERFEDFIPLPRHEAKLLPGPAGTPVLDVAEVLLEEGDDVVGLLLREIAPASGGFFIARPPNPATGSLIHLRPPRLPGAGRLVRELRMPRAGPPPFAALRECVSSPKA